MSHRFFVESPIEGVRARLVGAEAHHLTHVMRAQVGDALVLFDGSGYEFAAQVAAMSRSAIECEVIERRAVDREPSRRITLGVALPKRDRQRFLVEKAVEVGCGSLAPLTTERSVASIGENTLAKLRRTVIEASKQCGRNRLMEIQPPTDFREFVGSVSSGGVALLAHGDGEPFAEIRAEVDAAESIHLAVGPEGGFTEEETTLARDAGWRTVRLGPSTLRTETAALVLAGLCISGP